ncbi:MAG TPA: hypothetical protein PKD91_02605 [Bacteroidia bacterium]|nr:hypothetical protein [Bacteroidia bacterium]
MKKFKLLNLFLVLLLCASHESHAQCETKQRMSPDGSMLYYFEAQVFYFTKAKELKGNVVTDKEHYFIAFLPSPFPGKSEGKKMKDDLTLKLDNGKLCKLSYFDTRYYENDSIMELLYLIDKKDLKDISEVDTQEVTINMKGEESLRTYYFKLHKSAIREQMQCFLRENK